jgi:hypothetical protein
MEARDQRLVRLLMEQHDPEWATYGRSLQVKRINDALKAWYATRAHRIDLFVKDWIRKHAAEEEL